MQLSPGAHVRSFEVLGPLGAGGMGAVYRARDGKLGRNVAIKFLQDKLSDSREHLQRFQREARAASALNHPNIITIYEIGEHEGAPFIAMELVEGASLRELLKKGATPVRKLLDIVTQIADGLAAAHEQGIVHRDLKPENVMMTNDGRVKILDFGLARVNRPVTSADSTSELSGVRTPEGHVLGTAAYVSPEQASGARSVDYRSDQFSFGSVLYELATGRRAFARNSTVETLAAIVRDEPEPIQRVNPRLPPPLVWIVERCLAKDPADRYASTRDLARELRTLRERLPETLPGTKHLPASRGRRAAAVVIVAAVIAGGAAIVGSSDRFRKPTSQLPDQKYLAVLPFTDLSGRPDGQLFSQGFSDAVSSKLSKYSGVQVIPPASSAPLVEKKAGFKRIAQELGATLLVSASVQRAGDTLQINYSLVDPARGAQIAGDTVNGSMQNLWSVQDEVADTIARDLGIEQRTPPTKHVGLETAEEQDLYVKALGHLDRADDLNAIDAAINLLRELIEGASDSAMVQAALGRAYLAKYNITRDRQWADRALRACARAKALDADAHDVLLVLAEVERVTGQYANAISTYRRALAVQPNWPEAAVGLGRSLHSAKEFIASEQAFRRAIALRPTWWYSHHYLGVLHLSRGRYHDAGVQFAEVIRLNPDNPWGYINAGIVQLANGKLEEATASYTKAISLREDADAYSNLGYCYYFLGQYDKAAASARKATQLRPGVAAYWVSLGDACRWSSSCNDESPRAYGKAIELLRNDLAVNPENPRALASLAVCLAMTGEHSKATTYIDLALKHDPENPARMYQAARVANANNDPADAVDWLQRAVTAGYQKFEIERDPEFAQLRASQVFQKAFENTVHRSE